MRLSRRELAGALAGSAAAWAQTAATEKTEGDLTVQREQVRKNADALATVDIPLTLEPAFIFRP